MGDFAPITIRAVDQHDMELFSFSVPFAFEVSVKQILERAFILGQTPAKPDPFLYTLEYFGYSESLQFPGYLGYELERISGLSNDAQYFWSLWINDVASPSGAETTYPGPGSAVLWKYTPLPDNAHDQPGRSGVIHRRRAARRAKRGAAAGH
jgi:hypothetical protein